MDLNQKIITKNAGETADFGKSLARELFSDRGERLPRIICLYGDLGSGKTTFAQGFAKGLGISSRLLSPTFIIVRRHDLAGKACYLYHLDLYRLKDHKELEALGIDEILKDPNSYMAIEWAEKLKELLPKKRVDIHFNVLEDGSHEISIENNNNTIQTAINILNRGGIIIYPTDTAFGIGCRIDNYKAIDRLFRIRRRPLAQPTPVLVSSTEMALPYFDHPSQIVRRLMREYWPGALTVIYNCKKNLVYSPIRGGGETVGLRMPNHQTALTIIEGAGVPILGPSANFHGDPTPYQLSDLNPDLTKLVDLVVPGVTSIGQASTVVDCTVEPYKIIRQGTVNLE